MIHQLYDLSPALSKYLAAMVYNKDYYPEHKMDKYLPDGTMNIVFELTGTPKYIFDNSSQKRVQKCEEVWFSGVLKDYITISADHEEMMVVVFKPGAGFPFIQQPMDLYVNKVVPAHEVFGTAILSLLAELKEPSPPIEKFQTIEKWLLQRLQPDDFYTNIIGYAINEIENASAQLSISSLAERTGYSQKQLIELFKKYVGITPKQFHRIVRFNEILKAIEKEKQISWSSIAVDCGYFDQAHFIKDFQSFSGLNPGKYLDDIGDYPNYVPVR